MRLSGILLYDKRYYILLNICFINNYNYGRYLPEAINSALMQDKSFDMIIIVDDGSTDNSAQVIDECCVTNQITKVYKINGGQLSTFNTLIDYVPINSRVYFLDSDDVYPLNYLSSVDSILETQCLPHDFVFTDVEYLSSECILPQTYAKSDCIKSFVIPNSSLLTLKRRCWIGSPTSAISVSGELFHKLFPYPFQQDWRTRADDVLVYASSILGYQKTYLSGLKISYRVHNSNGFYGKVVTFKHKFRHLNALERLCSWYCNKYHIQVKLSHLINEHKLFPEDIKQNFGIPSKRRIIFDFFLNPINLMRYILKHLNRI